MASITKTASRGHHTFTLTVTPETTGGVVTRNGVKQCRIKVDYKLTMYGGSRGFNWSSKKVWWAIRIGENEFVNQNFGKYDAYTTLTITSGTCYVYQVLNTATTHSFSFSIDDTINQSYTPGNIAWADATSTFSTNVKWYTNVSVSKFDIEDHDNNSFSFTGTTGYKGGEYNPVKSVHIYYRKDGGRAYANNQGRDETGGKGWNGGTKTAGDPFEPCFFIDKDMKISAQSYTIGEKQNTPWEWLTNNNGNTTYAKDVKYYSQVGIPKDFNVNASVENNDLIIEFSAKKGDNGSNNNASQVEFQYQIGKGNKIDITSEQIQEGKITISNHANDISNITVFARTVGKFNGEKKVYIDNTLTTQVDVNHSSWISRNTSSTTITAPDVPKNLTIIDNSNNTFKIAVTMGSDGTNNTAIGTEIYYTTDGSDPTNTSIATRYTGGNIGVDKDMNVRAAARTKGVLSNSVWTTSEQTILYYQVPDIQKPIIKTSDGKKLTKKSNIIISAKTTVPEHIEFNTYTVSLYSSSSEQAIYSDICDFDEDYKGTISKQVDLKNDLQGDNLKKDDNIYAVITYDIQNGVGTNLVNNSNVPQSDLYLVESSGVMRVKANNSWYEGQAWVNVDGTWYEATDAFTNTNGSWKESV